MAEDKAQVKSGENVEDKETEITYVIKGPDEDGKFTAVIEEEPVYEFIVKRKKDEGTGLEVMEIQAQEVGETPEFLGTIHTRYLDIRTNVIEFLNYGVDLERKQLWAVADAIKKNYKSIKIQKTRYINNTISEKTIREFFNMLCKCIKDENIKPDKDLYHVEPQKLKEWYDESDYRAYNLTELKEELAALGYMKTSKGRNDNTIKDPNNKNKTKKVYSFCKDRVEEGMKQNEEAMKQEEEN